MKDRNNQNDRNVSFENCCVENGKRWFFLNEFNALCCMNEYNEIALKGIAPGENDSSIYLFADIKYFDNKLFLIPRGASALIVYDIEQNTFSRHEIKIPSAVNNNPYIDYLKFSIGVIYEEKLYMIPRTYPAIVVFDMKTETLEYETSWIEMINDYIFEGEAFFWADYSISNDELVLACANSDCVVRRSFVTNKYSIQYVPNDKNGFSGIEVVDNQMYLCSRKDGHIINIDENGHINRLNMPNGFKVDRIIGYSKLLKIDNYLYAIPMWSNYLIRVNTDNWQIEVVKDYDRERKENEEVATCCAWIENDKICIDNNLSHVIEVYFNKTVMEEVPLSIDSQFRKKRIETLAKSGIVIHENKYISLENYLECL